MIRSASLSHSRATSSPPECCRDARMFLRLAVAMHFQAGSFSKRSSGLLSPTSIQFSSKKQRGGAHPVGNWQTPSCTICCQDRRKAALDVLEHIRPEDEDVFLGNMTAALEESGTLIIGMPSLESQPYASRLSKGHVNCKSQPALKETMQRHFRNVYMFCMKRRSIAHRLSQDGELHPGPLLQ